MTIKELFERGGFVNVFIRKCSDYLVDEYRKIGLTSPKMVVIKTLEDYKMFCTKHYEEVERYEYWLEGEQYRLFKIE